MGRFLTVFGGTGVGIGILCCFTPLLPILLTAVGASGLITTLYTDSVLFPFVGISLIVMGVGLGMIRRSRE